MVIEKRREENQCRCGDADVGAYVCNTLIHRFKSGLRLSKNPDVSGFFVIHFSLIVLLDL